MNKRLVAAGILSLATMFVSAGSASAQMGRRLPPEKKVVNDPVTGVPLTFLTTDPASDSKIYQTHPQWTADGKWVIFRGNRPGIGSQAMAINEQTGDIVQITETGFSGMLCAAHKSNKLYIMRGGGGGGGGRGRGAATAPGAAPEGRGLAAAAGAGGAGAPPTTAPGARRGGRRGGGGGATTQAGGAAPARGPQFTGPRQIVEIDLEHLLADAMANTVKPASAYERVCGIIPPTIAAEGNMGIDANDDYAYFSVTGPETEQLSPGQTLQGTPEGARMGAGPAGLRSMNLKTGEIKFICNVGFKIGHVQTNPMVPGEIVFAWETGGKAPQRTWFVKADGSELRPLWPESPEDWVTHEAAFNADEVAIAILAHRRPGAGGASTGEYPSGLAIVNLRTREMRIAGQVPVGDPGRSDWHVAASPDGRWAAFDDFQYRLWLIDRKSGETKLLADLGHKTSAADHIHPTFSADSTRIEVQSAMLAEDNRALDICVVPVPKTWLDRTYPATFDK
jgi:oligogalacturonide lyase